MRVIIKENYEAVSLRAAHLVADAITAFKPTPKKPFVLGLPTGTSPLGMYRELIRMNAAKEVSFANVVAFVTEEFAGLSADSALSSAAYFRDVLFKHINIKKTNINLLNGTAADPDAECRRYERRIARYGGIHLFVGGISIEGNIAYNEPGSSLASRARVKTMTRDSILHIAESFHKDAAEVPRTVLTVGIGTIMEAGTVMILVSGRAKARALQQTVEGGVNHLCAISCMQLHPHGIIVCDDAATEEMKVKTVNYFKSIE